MNELLINLQQHIKKLETMILSVNWNDINQPLFDEQLFYTPKSAHSCAAYLDEIKHTYQILADCVASQNLEQTSFYAELLINQISALTRELSTHHLRTIVDNTMAESLEEKHSRHLSYLRQLQALKYELELVSDSINYPKIAALDNRIHCCQQAIKQIEKQMEDDRYFPS